MYKDVSAIRLEMDILISGTVAGKGWNIWYCLVVTCNIISQDILSRALMQCLGLQ